MNLLQYDIYSNRRDPFYYIKSDMVSYAPRRAGDGLSWIKNGCLWYIVSTAATGNFHDFLQYCHMQGMVRNPTEKFMRSQNLQGVSHGRIHI